VDRKVAVAGILWGIMKRALGKMVVGNVLTTAAIRYRDEPAIYCTSADRRFSFREVDERANRLAHALLVLGFCKGDVVAFLCTNRAEIVEIYFALARTGIHWPAAELSLGRFRGSRIDACDGRKGFDFRSEVRVSREAGRNTVQALHTDRRPEAWFSAANSR
jgi:hypothetical protein